MGVFLFVTVTECLLDHFIEFFEFSNDAPIRMIVPLGWTPTMAFLVGVLRFIRSLA